MCTTCCTLIRAATLYDQAMCTMRQVVACAVCAIKDWIDDYYPCIICKDAPLSAKASATEHGDEQDTDDDEEHVHTCKKGLDYEMRMASATLAHLRKSMRFLMWNCMYQSCHWHLLKSFVRRACSVQHVQQCDGYCTHGDCWSYHLPILRRLQRGLALVQSTRLLKSQVVLQSRQSLLVLGSEIKKSRLGYVIIVPVVCARHSPGCFHKH